jgi:CheY-like chemotaxis protein
VENSSKLKIIIVDDNQFINNSMKNLLEKVLRENNSDYDIIQLTDGIELIKVIIDDQSKGNLIKCVFTDENMEYINGSEAIRILRGLEKKNKVKYVKIFSISCQEDNIYTKLMKDSGADKVLTKPLSKNSLAVLMKEIQII